MKLIFLTFISCKTVAIRWYSSLCGVDACDIEK